ncbi:MAG: YCF48-related protein [Calditrichia bacterium]
MIYKLLLHTLITCFLFAGFAQGQTIPWEVLAQPTHLTLKKMDFVNTQTGWAVGDSGLIMRTDDAGANWVIQPIAVGDNVIDVEFVDANVGWALAPHRYMSELDPAGSWLLSTTDGGANWDSTWFRNEVFWGLTFTDANTGWMGGELGGLLGTTDGGVTWVEAVYEPGATTGFTLEDVSFVSPQVGFGIGGRFDLTSTIWTTANGGQTWRATNYGLEPMYDILYLDSQRFITVGGDFDFGAAVLSTENGGGDWTYFYTGFWGQGRAVAARTELEIYVPLGFAGTTMISKDKGGTWNVFENPGMVDLYDIVFFDSTNGLMIGGEGKVLRYNPILTGINEPNLTAGPVSFELLSNYPNPFNPSTTIRFNQERRSKVMLEVYSSQGKKVALLVNDFRDAGNHTVVWNGTNQRGDNVSSGVYLYRLTIGAESQSQKMLLVR